VTPIDRQTAEFDQLDYSTVARMLMTRRTVPQWLMVPVTNRPLSLEGPLSLDGAKRLIGVNLQTFSCTSVTCGCRYINGQLVHNLKPQGIYNDS
jgi:hypothetical protein